MGLFRNGHRALRKDSKREDSAVKLSEFGALNIDSELANSLQNDLPTYDDRPAIQVRPFKDNEGIESGRDFLQSVYEVERGGFRGRKNVSAAHSFEIRYTGERMNVQFVPDPDWTNTFESQLQDKYPNALIEQAPPETLSFDEGKFVAGTELDLTLYALYPIRNIDLEDFRRDPFGGITSAIEDSKKDGEATADVLMQVVFRPESRDWVHGVNGGPDIDTIAHNLKQPRYERKRRLFTKTTIEHPPSDIEKKAAKIVRDQHGERAWNVNIRIFTVSSDERVARRRVKKAATQFENYYETATEQKFVPDPLKGSDLRDGLDRLVRREWQDRGIVKSEAEAAGIIHIPNAEINQQNFDWALSKPGEGIPPGTARFDFDEHGVSMASAKEKQLEMLDSSGPDDPFWFGWGSKNGIEAGIFEHTLNAHMFVGGGTRKGKSTLLTNFTSQVMQRDYGGLVITLGKQDDDEDFIAEWPEDRDEEDFVFIDTGDDFEEMVRFNLLEVPDELEPGSVAHSSYVESLADDMSAAFAQTGGSDNYWGALMSRVTRTLIRGMTMSGKTCTPVDLAAACSSQGNLEKFADWMSEERVHFIRETAERIKEKEDSDLEPLAGRMDNVVHNSTLRTLLSTREPTVRIQDIVDDGKIAVLRLDPSLGETEKNFITTPLVRRFYNAKKMSDNENPFFCIWDEFDKAVTAESKVDEMLSEAGGYGLWFALACQAPSYQLPEKITDAVGSQVETFISFGTGDQDAKYIAGQHTVEDDDLKNLSRYTMYMRTHDENDDFTHSYRVNTFPPVREVRAEVGNGTLMSDVDISALKKRSVDRYGDVPETPEEIKSQSHFFAGGSPDEGAEGDADLEITDEIEALICKAAYDESLQIGSVDGFAPAEDVGDRIREYVDADIEHTSRLWDLVDQVPENKLERKEENGDAFIRCTSKGRTTIITTGSAASAGGMKHRELLKDLYDPLTRLGTRVRLPEQDGTDMPDAVAGLEDIDAMDELPPMDELAEMSLRKRMRVEEQVFERFEEENPMLFRLSDGSNIAIEAESSTGESKPAQTWLNLAQAINFGQRCLFACREDVAPNVWRTLTENGHYSHRWNGPHERYYNGGNHSIGGMQVFRPATGRETVWLRDQGTDEIVLQDSDGNEHARFPDAEAVFQDLERYPATESDIEGETDEWSPIKKPFIPEWELNEGNRVEPTEWDIVVVPNNPQDVSDLLVYNDSSGGMEPLPSLVTDGTDVQESTDSSDGIDLSHLRIGSDD